MALNQQLTALAPGRSEFADRLTDLTKLRNRREELRDHPERGLELVKYDWYRSGFDTIMMLNLTVRNDAPVPLKDMVVHCEHTAPSGTMIDSNTRTIYEVIRPHQTRRIRHIRHINMGFMQSQATRSACEISEAIVG